MKKNKKFLQVINGKLYDTPPVWLMRQAGRYLPEYRKTRATAGGFLDLCYNPKLAAEVTLQPIKRFKFDAAILFADILLIPQALGMKLWFVEGEGPRLEKLNSKTNITNLNSPFDIHKKLNPIYETIKILSNSLPNETALIGFAGAPWTVSTYMIAGCGSTDHKEAKNYIYKFPKKYDFLIELLTQATIEYLSKQISAGAEVVKLFDSWAGSLPGSLIEKYSLKPMELIAKTLKERHNNIPVIAFPRGAGSAYEKYSTSQWFDVLAIDTSVNPIWAKEKLSPNIVVQGNLDPLLMVSGGKRFEDEVKNLLKIFSSQKYIFNLGHGITPDAKVENVVKLLKLIKKEKTVG